jgi:hypothetical protein
MSNQLTCMVADSFSHYKLRSHLGRWFWRMFAIRQIFNEGYLAGWKAALIVEGPKYPTNTASLKSAAGIVKNLATWCKKYPESSTSPYAGIVEFREIEKDAYEFVGGKLQA